MSTFDKINDFSQKLVKTFYRRHILNAVNVKINCDDGVSIFICDDDHFFIQILLHSRALN